MKKYLKGQLVSRLPYGSFLSTWIRITAMRKRQW